MIRVGVLGAGGRMGRTVCQAVTDDPELALVAAIDPHHAGIDLDQMGLHGTGL
ncbi:MAG TPA: 4-hydroxy-tetrahydrodipicolinate reductase, partial [Acidimicrobiia bacterium]|nr:4-hydroxy-tetrahydrodipicolinate reductase [Acidimicrobiia bacterium]